MSKHKPGQIVAIQDTREQWPLDLASHGLAVEVGTLSYGDYSVLWPDLRKLLVVERKSLADFVACCTRERDRFERELVALRGYKYSYLVGEFTLSAVLDHAYRSRTNPDSVLGSIARWSTDGLRFLFCDNHEAASYVVARLLQFHAEQVLAWASAACARKNLVDEAAAKAYAAATRS